MAVPHWRNEFISGVRKQRPTVPVDTDIAERLSHPPHQESGLVMQEFVSAFAKLVPTQREALLLAVLERLPYDVISEHTGVSIRSLIATPTSIRRSTADILRRSTADILCTRRECHEREQA